MQQMADDAIAAIDAWESHITELRHETFEDEDAWVMKLDGQLRHLLDVVDSSGAPVTAGARERSEDLAALWEEQRKALQQITARYLEPLNAWADSNSIPHILTPLAE